MHVIGSALSNLADFIHCASNDFNPWLGGGRPDLPAFMDESGLEEGGFRIPGISLFRGYSLDLLRQRRFASREEAVDFIHLAKHVYNYYLHWIADGIRHFLEFGFHSHWNWGAGMAMAKTEILRRCWAHFSLGGHQDLQRFMSHQVLRNAMDFGAVFFYDHLSTHLIPFDLACASLISDHSHNRLLYVHRGGKVSLAIWPLSNPICDTAEVFLTHHLSELDCSVATLNRIVHDNDPAGWDIERDFQDESEDSDDSQTEDAE